MDEIAENEKESETSSRKEQIKKLIEIEGIFSLNQSELARKYNVSHTQIGRDIEEIMTDLPPINWVSLLNKSLSELDHTIKVVNQEMQNAKEAKTRANLATQLSEMVLRKMALMEKIDHLMPANMRPEPVTIRYKCTEEAKKEEKKDDPPEKEPDVVEVPSNG